MVVRISLPYYNQTIAFKRCPMGGHSLEKINLLSYENGTILFFKLFLDKFRIMEIQIFFRYFFPLGGFLLYSSTFVALKMIILFPHYFVLAQFIGIFVVDINDSSFDRVRLIDFQAKHQKSVTYWCEKQLKKLSIAKQKLR